MVGQELSQLCYHENSSLPPHGTEAGIDVDGTGVSVVTNKAIEDIQDIDRILKLPEAGRIR